MATCKKTACVCGFFSHVTWTYYKNHNLAETNKISASVNMYTLDVRMKFSLQFTINWKRVNLSALLLELCIIFPFSKANYL